MSISAKKIDNLLSKGLIKPSKSPWSCTAFYVNKAAEQERGVPRLVINYKPLNKVLKWIRYPISNKKDLLDKLHEAIIFSKFDLKFGYWQIQISDKDKYKTTFNVPMGFEQIGKTTQETITVDSDHGTFILLLKMIFPLSGKL